MTILSPAYASDTLFLPTYLIQVPPEEFLQMVIHPEDDIELSATITINGNDYPATLSLRGTTSRTLPKKSYNIHFIHTGPAGEAEINLNAEYRDTTKIRNAMAMELASRLGLAAPSVQLISLVVNDAYQGVYTVVEEVDDNFFDARDIPVPDFLIKATTHGGRFVPLLYPEQFYDNYEVLDITQEDLDEYLEREMIFQFGSPGLLALRANTILDIERVLDYFVLQFAVMNNDGFTKNYFLFRRTNGLYELIPWDCDASFGNHWNGVWHPEYIQMKKWTFINQNPLFSRLMEREIYREYFNQRLRTVSEDYFPALESWLDDQYEALLHDSRLDPYVTLDSAAFDTAWTRLHSFLEGRESMLEQIDYFHRLPVLSWRVRLLTDPDREDSLAFTASVSDGASEVLLGIGNVSSPPLLPMELDENADKSLPDEQVWTLTLPLDAIDQSSAYVFFTRYADEDYFMTPAGGTGYYEYSPPSLPMLPGQRSESPQPGEVKVGPRWVSPTEQSHLVSIINHGSRTVNTEGLWVSLGASYLRVQLAAADSLVPGDTLFLTDQPEIEAARNSDRRIYGPYPLSLIDEDTLRILDYEDRLLDSEAGKLTSMTEKVGALVINEINYHSSDDFQTGDWVELYLRDRYQSITHWTLRDDNPNHRFDFIEADSSTMLASGGYLVIAEDPDFFAVFLPDVPLAANALTFGFGNNGDRVCLYNTYGRLVDMVDYDDQSPWPTAADGQGPTLELIHPDSGNADPSSWRRSLNTAPYGTPGRKNSVTTDTVGYDTSTFERWTIASVFPNPSGEQFRIQIMSPDISPFVLSITNVLGREVALLKGTCFSPGRVEAIWDGTSGGHPVSSGVYWLRIIRPSRSKARKIVLLR